MHQDDTAQRKFVNDPVRMKRQADWELKFLKYPLLAAVLVLAGLLMSGCTEKVVHSDKGGYISERAKEIAALRLSGEPVQIRGTCFSACTMYLSLDNVCVWPEAVLGFHGPSAKRALGQEEFDDVSHFIATHYPTSLQKWFMDTARHSQEIVKITGSEAIRRGVKECT